MGAAIASAEALKLAPNAAAAATAFANGEVALNDGDYPKAITKLLPSREELSAPAGAVDAMMSRVLLATRRPLFVRHEAVGFSRGQVHRKREPGGDAGPDRKGVQYDPVADGGGCVSVARLW